MPDRINLIAVLLIIFPVAAIAISSIMGTPRLLIVTLAGNSAGSL